MPSRLAFLFESRYVGEVLERVWETLKSGISEGLTAKAMIKNIGSFTQTYRYQDMLHDIRAMKAIGVSATGGYISEERAKSWYDSHIEPYRAERGIHGKEAWAAFHKWERLEADSAEELEELEAAADEYHWYRKA
jgi:hypothetical protein